MNGQLWKYFLEDDVEGFVAALQAHRGHASAQAAGFGMSYSSSYGVSTSPTASFKTRVQEKTTPVLRPQDRQNIENAVSRAEVNRKDTKGLTLLHHAASLQSDAGLQFALALLGHPQIDIHAQDFENGWTALHRAFYFGNISVARAIVERESQVLPGQGGSASLNALPSLIKIKDHEGLAPYDLLSATITDRTLRHPDNDEARAGEDRPSSPGSAEEYLVQPIRSRGSNQNTGDEVFTFGSNRNLSLGIGDGDDRHYPERVNLTRSDGLLRKMYSEDISALADGAARGSTEYSARLHGQAKIPLSVPDLPNSIRSKAIKIADVQMAKFHTAILTDDSVTNLYICGHGPGGRLGLANQRTQFTFVPLDDFGQDRKKIIAVALGQDHSLAVSDVGALYTWGSNAFGQLGCGLPKENAKPDECIQPTPKQLFGPLKRESIVGVAASRIHSVAYTSTALFTFGKNEGQLGLVDSQAGTLKIQAIPRQVQASRLACGIHSIAAIDRATIVLLENHEVHVFANYGAVKLQFPLESSFSNYFLDRMMPIASYDRTPNHITKVTAGGDTICALSNTGEVFTVTVQQRLDPGSASTTNPKQIRAALSSPFCAWSRRTDRMLARDVGVDADGSIILSTSAGNVWRRVRRAKVGSNAANPSAGNKKTDFKFMRVPNLTRVVGVRASAAGSYAAIKQECDITRTEVAVSPTMLQSDMTSLISFNALKADSEIANPAPVFWQRPSELTKLTACISQVQDVEDSIASVLRRRAPADGEDLFIAASSSETMIPAHSFLFTGRCQAVRAAFGTLKTAGIFENDTFKLSTDSSGKLVLTFTGADFLTIIEIVMYFYSDCLVGFWQFTRRSPELAYRYRQVRNELVKIASRLELRNLESAARNMITRPENALKYDMELAILDQSYFSSGDAIVQLADGDIMVHSVLMAKRCPFFEGLFHGQASGHWLAQRRDELLDSAGPVNIDLSHVEVHVFKLVLRHIYADTGVELFDLVACKDLDEYLDLVMEVLSVANELMLDRLSQVCQSVLGRYVNTRNACQVLTAVAPCSVPTLKHAILEYLCLNLEAMLTNRWLDELDEELLEELDEVVRDNQLAAQPFARSGRAEQDLHSRHPQLAELIRRSRQAKIDAIGLQSKFPDINTPISKSRTSPIIHAKSPSTATSPTILAKSPAFRAQTSIPSLEPLSSPTPLELPPASTVQTPPQSRDGPTVATERPWGASSAASAQPSMKDILSQASSAARPSNIALGLRSQSNADVRSSSSQSPRVSQKERKRQQQIQRTETSTPLKPTMASAASSPAAASSPWKTVITPKRASLPAADASVSPFPGKPSTPEIRPTATPQLTMRQTIANAPSQKPSPQQQPQPQQQRRSASSPQVPSNKAPHDGPGMAVGSSAAIPIQSVRHTRRPDTASALHMNQSLADIISYEQAEKRVLQESVAKRSLQEIQEEQAFQEWWAQESKAVQEQAARSAASPREGRGGRHRGRARRSGKQRADH